MFKLLVGKWLKRIAKQNLKEYRQKAKWMAPFKKELEGLLDIPDPYLLQRQELGLNEEKLDTLNRFTLLKRIV